MKIGVYFTSSISGGGVYQYSLALLESLSKINTNKYIIFSSSNDIPRKYYKLGNFKIINMDLGIVGIVNMLGKVGSYGFSTMFKVFPEIYKKEKVLNIVLAVYKSFQFGLIKVFKKENPDLIFYPTLFEISTFVEIPAIVSIHDLQYKLHPKFKEVSSNGIMQLRDFNYTRISKHAYKIFVDSSVGKEDLLHYYPKSERKIIVLPYLTPSYINSNISSKEIGRVKQKYSLPDNYVFYPAKFWPHKNHKNLIKALVILKKQGKKLYLVLTGSKHADFSSFDEVMKLVERDGVKDQVIYLGLVSNEELPAIYKLATALVMPTYFGPTNIPVIEAWTMGTPVIYSDIRGCREQLGNAGLLINPNNPRDIADKILKIYTQPKLASELIKRGHERISQWTSSDFLRKIEKVIEDYEKEKSVASKSNKK